MDTTQQLPEESQFNLWIRAIRPFSFSASMIPIIVGAMYAWYEVDPVKINWFLFPIVILASLLIHSGTNLVSEYYDYVVGVDREDSYGSSRVLVDKLIQPKKILYAGYLCFGLTFILGMILVS
ncbi:MAG: prenyltransferase, partial [Candidatus Kapabacteria bacterium]|nr:prenyltransferase [Candidatus Kapabacteria bacterium]